MPRRHDALRTGAILALALDACTDASGPASGGDVEGSGSDSVPPLDTELSVFLFHAG